jgi:hypothetical protein
MPNFTFAILRSIDSSLKHPEDNVVVTPDESIDLGSLVRAERIRADLPAIACIARESLQDSGNGLIDSVVDVDDELSKIGQTGRPRNAGTRDEEDSAFRVREKQTLRKRRQVLSENYLSITAGNRFRFRTSSGCNHSKALGWVIIFYRYQDPRTPSTD